MYKSSISNLMHYEAVKNEAINVSMLSMQRSISHKISL